MKASTQRPHRRIGRFLIAGATLSLLIVLIVRLSHPAHEFDGKPLTEWLDSPTVRMTNWQTYGSNRIAAFQSAGIEGVALLLRESEAVDSRWNWLIARWAKKPPLRNWTKHLNLRVWKDPYARSGDATGILDAFPEYPRDSLALFARSFERTAAGLVNTNVPDINLGLSLAEYRNQRLLKLALRLRKMGDSGFDYLTNQLVQARSPEVQRTVLTVLSRMGTNASRAVPAVAAAAEKPDLLPFAAYALAEIHGDPDLTIPVLVRAATNGHHSAIYALGGYGPQVRPWLSQLSILTNHPDVAVRFQWNIAERKIGGH